MMTETRRKLIAALREIPQNFVWDFDRFYDERFIPETPEQEKFCGACGCAMGLVQHLKLIDFDHDWWRHDRDRVLAKALGMTRSTVRRAFYSALTYDRVRRSDVTPQEVADHLESLP